MKKIAVVLSGCGYLDGSEITESISTLIALGQAGASYECFAPDDNFPAMDHVAQQPAGERNALKEAARIARGKVRSTKELKEPDFDALIFPGGYGAAKNLCDWAVKGSQCNVRPEIESAILAFHKASKPIGAICIAPALIARVLGPQGVTVTIGTDAATAEEIEKTGAHHEKCAVTDYVSDRQQKIVTTPAYMYDEAKPSEVFQGIKGLVNEVTEMA
jgi:enhancing lycopene biosynthesis protein 2